MTGCNLGISAEIPPVHSKLLHPLSSSCTVPRCPGDPLQGIELGEGQKRKRAHLLGWCLLSEKVKISVGSCKFRSRLGSNWVGSAKCVGLRG